MRNLIFLSLILLYIFSSCEKDNNITKNVSPDINFYPLETFENYNSVDTPNLKLFFATDETYMYGGGILHFTKEVENQELVIIFDSIQIYSGGFFEEKSATCYVDLPEYINKLTLINGSFIDKYDVSISKEKVEINSVVNDYSDLIFDKIFRYPENTFNFTCWTDIGDKNLCDDFLTILNNELSLSSYEFIGEGEIPFPYYTSTEPNHCTGVFKYENESDYDRAGELLKEFTLERIPQNEGKSISLWGWNNKNFHSHTFYE